MTNRHLLLNIVHVQSMRMIFSYCLEDLEFEYVLLGKFQTDHLEGRFGWYRQLSGGNYYISLRQLMGEPQKVLTLFCLFRIRL